MGSNHPLLITILVDTSDLGKLAGASQQVTTAVSSLNDEFVVGGVSAKQIAEAVAGAGTQFNVTNPQIQEQINRYQSLKESLTSASLALQETESIIQEAGTKGAGASILKQQAAESAEVARYQSLLSDAANEVGNSLVALVAKQSDVAASSHVQADATKEGTEAVAQESAATAVANTVRQEANEGLAEGSQGALEWGTAITESVTAQKEAEESEEIRNEQMAISNKEAAEHTERVAAQSEAESGLAEATTQDVTGLSQLDTTSQKVSSSIGVLTEKFMASGLSAKQFAESANNLAVELVASATPAIISQSESLENLQLQLASAKAEMKDSAAIIAESGEAGATALFKQNYQAEQLKVAILKVAESQAMLRDAGEVGATPGFMKNYQVEQEEVARLSKVIAEANATETESYATLAGAQSAATASKERFVGALDAEAAANTAATLSKTAPGGAAAKTTVAGGAAVTEEATAAAALRATGAEAQITAAAIVEGSEKVQAAGERYASLTRQLEAAKIAAQQARTAALQLGQTAAESAANDQRWIEAKVNVALLTKQQADAERDLKNALNESYTAQVRAQEAQALRIALAAKPGAAAAAPAAAVTSETAGDVAAVDALQAATDRLTAAKERLADATERVNQINKVYVDQAILTAAPDVKSDFRDKQEAALGEQAEARMAEKEAIAAVNEEEAKLAQTRLNAAASAEAEVASAIEVTNATQAETQAAVDLGAAQDAAAGEGMVASEIATAAAEQEDISTTELLVAARKELAEATELVNQVNERFLTSGDLSPTNKRQFDSDREAALAKQTEARIKVSELEKQLAAETAGSTVSLNAETAAHFREYGAPGSCDFRYSRPCKRNKGRRQRDNPIQRRSFERW